VSLQVLYGVNQRLRVEDVDSPLCEVRPVKTVLLVVLTGDRGLCGGYNNFIIKKVCWGLLAAAAAVLGQHAACPPSASAAPPSAVYCLYMQGVLRRYMCMLHHSCLVAPHPLS
jgi:hypothetical protein